MNGWDFLAARSRDEKLLKIPTIVCSAGTEKIPTEVRFEKKPMARKTLLKLAEEYCQKSTV